MMRQELWKQVIILIVIFLFLDLFIRKWTITYTLIFITAYIATFLILRFFLIKIFRKYRHLAPEEKIVTSKSVFGSAFIFMGLLMLIFGIFAFIKNSELTELVMIMVSIFFIILGFILMYYSSKLYKRLEIKKKMYSSHSILIGSLFLVFGIFSFIKKIEPMLIVSLITFSIIFFVLGFILGLDRKK